MAKSKAEVRDQVQCILAYDRKHDKGGCKLFNVNEGFRKKNFFNTIHVFRWNEEIQDWEIKDIIQR